MEDLPESPPSPNPRASASCLEVLVTTTPENPERFAISHNRLVSPTSRSGDNFNAARGLQLRCTGRHGLGQVRQTGEWVGAKLVNIVNTVRAQVLDAALVQELLKREWAAVTIQIGIFTVTLGFLAGAQEGAQV